MSTELGVHGMRGEQSGNTPDVVALAAQGTPQDPETTTPAEWLASHRDVTGHSPSLGDKTGPGGPLRPSLAVLPPLPQRLSVSPSARP